MSTSEALSLLTCASCRKPELFGVKLKFCTACHLVKYCGVECQREHRSMHKKACKERAAELLRCSTANVTAASDDGRKLSKPSRNEVNHDELARMVENGDIDTDRIIFASSQTVTLPSSLSDGADLETAVNEAKLIADRRMVLQQAHLRFSCLARMSYNSGLDFERYYRDLYEDILKYHDVWFYKLFNVDNVDPTPAEFTTGILGTLCTILRQRGDLEECTEVMKTYMAVLKRYQQMTEGCGSKAQVDCCEGLTFKANIIRLNLGVQIDDKAMAMTAFHDITGAYRNIDRAKYCDPLQDCFMGFFHRGSSG